MTSIDDLTEEQFGHWLAGFIDGEASFNILKDVHHRQRTQPVTYYTRMVIHLRADDAPLLRAIHKRTGLGFVGGRPARSTRGGAIVGQAQATWSVGGKSDAVALVKLLDRHPLMSKKARDYAIWRRAVANIAGKRRLGPWRPNDWSAVSALKAELEAARRYVDPADEAEPRAVILPEDPRLPFGDAA